MERLALLKTNAPGLAGPDCPPEEVLLEIAARMAPQDAETCLRHAANCDHCGLLLRQAMADFAEELTPQEEAQISSLSSSTSGWQSSMAAKLHGNQDVIGTPSALGTRRQSLFAAFFSPFRLAFAAAIIGLVLLGTRDYQRSRSLSRQSPATAAVLSQQEEQLIRQKAQIAELTAELKRPATAPPGPKVTEQLGAVSFTLDGAVTRGSGVMKRLSIPPEVEIVRITIPLAPTPDTLIREELLSVDRQQKWSQELRPSDAEKRSGSLTLLVPAYLLTPDDYLIVLSRELPRGPEEIATYVFRVAR